METTEKVSQIQLDMFADSMPETPGQEKEKVIVQEKQEEKEFLPAGTKLEIHPAAEEYPQLSYEEYRAMENSIKERGLDEPIKLSQGRIIDGRHRYRVCIKLEIPIPVEELNLSEEEIYGYVYSTNIRRSLSAGQWAFLALKKLPEYEARAELRKLQNLAQNTDMVNLPQRGESGRAIDLLAEEYPVSASCIQFAKQIEERKPELREKVCRNEISLFDAYKKSRPRPVKEKKPKAMPKVEIPLGLFDEFLQYIPPEKLQEYSTHVTGMAKIAITKYLRHIKPDSVQKEEK